MGLCIIEGGAAAAAGGGGGIDVIANLGIPEENVYYSNATDLESKCFIISDATSSTLKWKTVAENVDLKNYNYLIIRTLFYPYNGSHSYSTASVYFNDANTGILLRNSSIYSNNTEFIYNGSDRRSITTTTFFPLSSYDLQEPVTIKIEGHNWDNNNKRLTYLKFIVYGIKGEIEE